MPENLEYFYFSQRCHWHPLLFVVHEDALQRNEFASRAVLCLVNLPEETVSP